VGVSKEIQSPLPFILSPVGRQGRESLGILMTLNPKIRKEVKEREMQIDPSHPLEVIISVRTFS
jgi:hypothetical protein